jgi:hypothetical protein
MRPVSEAEALHFLDIFFCKVSPLVSPLLAAPNYDLGTRAGIRCDSNLSLHSTARHLESSHDLCNCDKVREIKLFFFYSTSPLWCQNTCPWPAQGSFRGEHYARGDDEVDFSGRSQHLVINTLLIQVRVNCSYHRERSRIYILWESTRVNRARAKVILKDNYSTGMMIHSFKLMLRSTITYFDIATKKP